MDNTEGVHKLIKREIFIHNESNRIATPILAKVKELAKPFIGKKIDTLKGLSAKFGEVLKIDNKSITVNPLPNTQWASVQNCYVSTSSNDLKLTVDLCFSTGDGGCTYDKSTFYFGRVDDKGILTEIKDDCHVSEKVLDFDTEIAKINQYVALRKQADKIKSTIQVSSDAYKYL